jgi:hypothetical protein
VWNGDLPRPLQQILIAAQILFEAADGAPLPKEAQD